ncbi:MAG TPA: DinB family protein [Mycobacteriales bacterium]|nr:DinB family protein [Mycobacteriales bacterium]
MDDPEFKAFLTRYLTHSRDALLWKLDGLSDFDVRRPLTPTASNLLGLLKHVALTSAEYFGIVFDRPFPGIENWFTEESPDNADMWATAEQSRDDVLELWQRAWAHADATIAATPLSGPGRVPWWPAERATVTLQQVLVHNIDEVGRHAGHADILRELIDGEAGLTRDNGNLPEHDAAWWRDYRAQVQAAADAHR